MLEKEKLQRINALAAKKKAGSIKKDELEELKGLREEYLKNFRSSFRKQVENTKVVDPEGNDVTPEKLKRIQEEKKTRD
ncbi:DUF896 domain-containing protein [Salinicoccus sp. ID82-1]|uniref:DUF896 domain-containing protein n=1 Tax=Salinicoccus sp. ID82-1 TaxID=2820269 RepID=UPI001F3AB000|nr:DUF896 domain-containing protein [Salinicoccus sp. ID82-1]MCG1008782.1 DUF896 domain-containing protein [Salinicoccus sp. ID82-1]